MPLISPLMPVPQCGLKLLIGKLLGLEPVSFVLLKGRLRWFGHV